MTRPGSDHDPDAHAAAGPPAATPLRLTVREWRTVLERRSFLEREDNRFQTPRQFCGRPVQIVPDDSFR